MTEQNTGARNRGRRATLATWAGDLVLGVRLAMGGGRTSKTGLARLVLGAIGIGLAVVVLLLAASAMPAIQAQSDRSRAMDPQDDLRPGVDPLYIGRLATEYRSDLVFRNYVHPTGPNSPVPPGLRRLPGPGEVVLSPALAELLASPDGELLRPRFPEKVIGTIDQSGLKTPSDLRSYAGAGAEVKDTDTTRVAYGFGGQPQARDIPLGLLIMLVLGLVVVLIPVFIFVASSARIAGAERDRRLAALRLVGSDARQVRRIAAAESLAAAVAGLLLGGGLFLMARASAANFELMGVSFFPSDLTPSPLLTVLILVAVPALAVLTAQFALRRTIIEPLGVVRQSKPIRRRMLWRLALIVVGIGMLFLANTGRGDDTMLMVLVVGGATLLLIGVPAVLPVLLERAMSRFGGAGRPAVMLAVRRLQLDSGTPARVVGGIAVVLAGAIALQAVLTGQANQYNMDVLPPGDSGQRPALMGLHADDRTADAALTAARGVPGVSNAYMIRHFSVSAGSDYGTGLGVADCETLRRLLKLDSCTDGDVFQVDNRQGQEVLRPGTTVTFMDQQDGKMRKRGAWQLPKQLRDTQPVPDDLQLSNSIMATPGALRGVTTPEPIGLGRITLDVSRLDVIEDVRNALVPFMWHASAYTVSGVPDLTSSQKVYRTFRNALLAGSLFTLLLAGVSLLVVALEQMRERRKVIAALSATGVPTSTLARSLLWQTAIPMLLAVSLSVATGIVLAALVFRLTHDPFTMDWSNVGLMSAAAVVLVLLVTALTLPSLRSATRLTALRSE